jgi:hypothetical protein
VSQYGDGDYPSVHVETTPRARKTYVCRACHEPIKPGQRYHRSFFVWEGIPDTTRRCERCQAIYTHLSARIRAEGDGEEFCDDDLNCGHSYEERWEEPPPAEIAALAFWLPGDPLPKETQ